MRRILLLITDLEIGGTPTVVRELAKRLHEPGRIEVQVACLKSRGPIAAQMEAAGVPVSCFDARSSFHLPKAVRQLRELVKRDSIDTVVSFLVHANAVAAIAARKLPGVRFLQSIQTTQPYPRWHWKVQRFAQRRADKIVVPSLSVARVAREWSNIPNEKIVIIPNAVDVPEAGLPLQTSTSSVESWQGGNVHVGFLGRLDPIKRVTDLVSAVALLDSRFVLDVYGDGANRATIEREIDRLNLNPRVTLHGATANPQAAIQGMHVLALPSQAEGFGLVLIEAMALGVPVVATDVDGIRDVVEHEKTGLLVPVASPDALAAAIRRVSEDEPLRTQLVRNALEHVRQSFSWERVMAEYRKLLKL